MVLFQSAKQLKILFVHFSSVIKLAAPEICQADILSANRKIPIRERCANNHVFDL